MDAIMPFLTDWGYVGLFLASFIAGSVVPFSSEAVLIACIGPLQLSPLSCLTAATLGNVSGGMTCYWIGHLGKTEWIEKYLHVNQQKREKAERFDGFLRLHPHLRKRHQHCAGHDEGQSLGGCAVDDCREGDSLCHYYLGNITNTLSLLTVWEKEIFYSASSCSV